MVRPHRRLKVWEEGIELVEEIYQITKELPDAEKYGLISQLRRAAVSVPANIAEGAGRQTNKEFKNFLFISSGSLSEIETLLIISKKLNYISNEVWTKIDKKIQKIAAMINGLIKKIKKEQ